MKRYKIKNRYIRIVLFYFPISLMLFFFALVAKTFIYQGGAAIWTGIIIYAAAIIFTLTKAFQIFFLDSLMLLISKKFPDFPADSINLLIEKKVISKMIVGLIFFAIALAADAFIIYDYFNNYFLTGNGASDKALENLLAIPVLTIFTSIPLFIGLTRLNEVRKIIKKKKDLEQIGGALGYSFSNNLVFSDIYPGLGKKEKQKVIQKGESDATISIYIEKLSFGQTPYFFLVTRIEMPMDLPFFYIGRNRTEAEKDNDLVSGSLDLFFRPNIGKTSHIDFPIAGSNNYELVAEEKYEIEIMQIFTEEVLAKISQDFPGKAFGAYGRSFYIFCENNINNEILKGIDSVAEYFISLLKESGIKGSMKAMRELEKI